MKSIISNIFVIVYIAGTMWIRFLIEPQLKGHYIISIAFGVFALVFLWALIKTKIIRPTVLGLHTFIPDKKNSKLDR